MKTSLILFRSADDALSGEYLDKLISVFRNNGFTIDRVQMLSFSDDLGFTRSLDYLKDVSDNLIVVYDERVTFNLKEIVADNFDSPLAENENARRFLDAVINAHGKPYPEDYAEIPVDATLIPNVVGAFQGFMIDDKEFTLALFPHEIKELSVMADKYLIPYLETKYNLQRKRITLKYMGDVRKVYATVEKAKEISENAFTYFVTERFGDVKIDFIFENFNQGGADALRYIVSELKEDVYAEYDVSLSQRLFDILTLKKLRLSTAESFTSGTVASAVLEHSGASNIFHESVVCYSNKSKIKRLGVKVEDLSRSGAVSSIVAYQMALGLLRESECDVAISTTGIAGPKSDDTEKPVGLCFIGVGMRDGIHTYKLNLSGSREDITQTAKNTAMFLAIKKLKNLK